MANLIGKDIGRYHIIEQVGEGGMATVYKAFDTRLECEVAIKFIRKENILPNQLERMIVRFEREAKRMAKFTHPNIVKVIDFGEYQGSPYLVMPYLVGGTLKDKLQARAGKPIPYQEAARILAAIAHALEYAHEQDTIHRDVKPANILLTEKGQPLLTDFGVAKILDLEEGNTLTGTGVGVGTPEYMAPEQWMNKIVPQTDIYALGVVFYEMVTGRKPYTADTPAAVLVKQSTEPLMRPRQLNPSLSEEAERVIYKAMAKDPLQRYADMGAMAEALEKLGQGGWIAAATSPAGEQNEITLDYREMAGGVSGREPQEAKSEEKAVTPRPVWKAETGQVNATPLPEVPTSKSRKQPFLLLGILGIGLLVIIGVIGMGNLLKPADGRSGVAQTQTAMVAVQTGVSGTQTVLASTPTLSLSLQGEGQGEGATEKYPTITRTPIASNTPLATNTPLASNTPEMTSTPQAGMTRVSQKDGMVSLFVPAGEFLMGSTDGDSEASSNEKPQHKVDLDGYWMDKTEVTNAMYQKCVADGSCKDPVGGKDSNTHTDYYDNSQYANYPVVRVGLNQAQAYCQWAGGRLPSEAQWEKAARGTDGRKYPWGDGSPDSSLLNYNRNVGDTTEVGKYPSGASPYGVLDMSGNVWEWVNDWYAADYYANSPQRNPTGPDSGEFHGLRGGSWYYGAGDVRAAVRGWGNPDFRNGDLGFRCVR